mgnify:CR=1 FL=1
MVIFESAIFAIVAALVSLKAILLAAAVLLFIHSPGARIQKRKAAPRRSSPGHTRLGLRA